MLHSTFFSRLFAGSLVIAAALAGSIQVAAADTWTVKADASRLTFEAKQAGAAFSGAFPEWSADITFDPEDLAASKVAVIVDIATATTGDAQRDANLPTPNWFDAGTHPKAIFQSAAFKKNGDDTYEAAGDLTLRGITKPATLVFKLTIDGDAATMTGTAKLNRHDFEIGKGVPDQMIAPDVTVGVELSAARVK